MRFLLFNLVVAGALIHLFGATPKTEAVSDSIASIKGFLNNARDVPAQMSTAAKPVAAEQGIDNPSSEVVRSAPENKNTEQTSEPASVPSEETAEGTVTANASEQAMPPLDGMRDVRSSPKHAVPPRVELTVKAETSVERANAPEFMTPRQRWLELNRLAQDMETMFVDKLSP